LSAAPHLQLVLDGRPKRAAIYVRISKDSKGEALGVTRQIAACQGLCALNGFEVFKIYDKDNDYSASEYATKPRLDYEQMVRDLRAGLFDVIVVWDQDRLVRQLKELEELIPVLKKHKVDLAVCTGEVDVKTTGGRLKARILGAVGAHESEHKSERILEGIDQSARAGKPHGGPRAYGFERDGITHRVDEVRHIEWMAERVLAGASLTSIAKDLNGRGVTTSQAGRVRKDGSVARGSWSAATIKSILISPRTAGRRLHITRELRAERGGGNGLTWQEAEQHYKAVWEPVLDEETWSRVRKALVDPLRAKSNTNRTKHLLAGVLQCHNCGSNLILKTYATGRAPRYVCDARRRAHLARMSDADTATCGGRSIHQTLAEDHVSVQFLAWLNLNFTRLLGYYSQGDGTRIHQIAVEIQQDEELLDDISLQIASRQMSPSVGAKAAKVIEARLEKSRRALGGVESPTDLPTFLSFDQVLSWWNDEKTDPLHRRALMRLFIERVNLFEAGDCRMDVGRLSIKFRTEEI
jgi:site-specific DNA recombinase